MVPPRENGQDYRPGPSLEDESGGIDPTTVEAIQAAQDRAGAKQRGTLEGGLVFREGGGLPTTYPGGVSHEQLYVWSQEPDPGALDEDGQGWNDDGNAVQELAIRLGSLAGGSGTLPDSDRVQAVGRRRGPGWRSR